MSRSLAVFVLASIFFGAAPGVAAAHHGGTFTPGAPGIGDPYFPLDGNGGYDARHYGLHVAYDPDTDTLSGVASMRARATQNLSSFNLDLVGMNVRAVWVDGRRATWSRSGDELTIEPRRGVRKHRRFHVLTVYDGVPQTLPDGSGFIHTDDGTLVAGQPDVAATWYPVNDHPADKASYTFRITVPAGLEAVANGELEGRRTRHGRTTWEWRAREPMASYLTTATIGEFDLRHYRAAGIEYWDALDPDLYARAEPRTGDQFAFSQVSDGDYKRLARTIAVPAGGAQLSFWVWRDIEQNWDFMFVEAHTAGADDWTTLADANGHTSTDPGFGCPGWLEPYPFLAHYQTDNGDGTCSPTGTTGSWNAATGTSDGWERWTVDLSAYAGEEVEVAISYVNDDVFSLPGVFVDDIAVSNGAAGSTSFEDDGDELDGWTVPGPPPGTEPNENDWTVGTAAEAPPPVGEIADRALARQPEIIAFLEDFFGPYPFSAAGAIVDDLGGLGFALENQTRPVYAKEWFADQVIGQDVIVHELAHQWVGNSLALALWRHIWLNEGFATYSEWLWSEREGRETAQELFEGIAAIPADDPFWSVTIGDPGPDALFDGAVYSRGAATLHALRLEIGDADFFRLLRVWAQSREGDNVATDEFVALAERISGEQLDALFEAWLFTPAKPAGIEPAPAAARTRSAARSLAVDAAAGRAVKR